MNHIVEPTLLLDKEKCLYNIAAMANKAAASGVIFRPHFKTHQSLEIGRWFRDCGVNRITTSSLKMAEAFAADGWDEITVAFPVNLREIERINALAQRITLNLLVESPKVVSRLSERLTVAINMFIKIDVGYHRTGVDASDVETIGAILKEIASSPLVTFKGFLTHAGHSYNLRGKEALMDIHRHSVEKFTKLRQRFIVQFPDLIISIGDTPTCSVVDDLTGVDEIRPGNFVFYDAMQAHIGSCSLEQIAVTLACPVVAKHPDRHEIILYGGAVHFSKDYYLDAEANKVFGLLVWLTDDSWKQAPRFSFLRSLSQEHGILKVDAETFQTINEGDVVGILPVHSCLTANLMRCYQTLDGKVIDRI